MDEFLELTKLIQRRSYRAALELALRLYPKMSNNPFLLRLIASLHMAIAHSPTTSEEGWVLEEEAIQWGERAVQIAPHVGWLWAKLGWDYTLHLDYAAAHRAFRAALKHDPCCASALSGLASMWSLPDNEGGKWISRDEMITHLKRVVELEHGHPGSAIAWLVRELWAAGRSEEAREYVIRALLSFEPPEPEIINMLVNILTEQDSNKNRTTS